MTIEETIQANTAALKELTLALGNVIGKPVLSGEAAEAQPKRKAEPARAVKAEVEQDNVVQATVQNVGSPKAPQAVMGYEVIQKATYDCVTLGLQAQVEKILAGFGARTARDLQTSQWGVYLAELESLLEQNGGLA